MAGKKWVVAPKLTEKFREKYDIAITQAQFNALKQEFEREMGAPPY